jgi:hypothetical protein
MPEVILGENQVNLYNAKEMKKVLQKSEVALWLESYDDIFSDFDPRPFSQRAISDDFLLEVMKASRDRGNESAELKFLIAPEIRDHNHEAVIKKRLRECFTKEYHKLIKERKAIFNRALFFVSAGIILMFVSSLVAFFYLGKHIMFNFVVAITEPAGWFLFWEGLNRTIKDYRKVNPNFEFYRKLSKSNISFLSY